MSASMMATRRYFKLMAILLLVACIWLPSRAYSIGFEIVRGDLEFEFQGNHLSSQFIAGPVAGYLNQDLGSGIFMISCDILLEPERVRFATAASTPTFFVSRPDNLLIVVDVSSGEISADRSQVVGIWVLAYQISPRDMKTLLNEDSGRISGQVVELGPDRYNRLVKNKFLILATASYAAYKRINSAAPNIPFSVFQRAWERFNQDPNAEAQIYVPRPNDATNPLLVTTNASGGSSQWQLGR